MPSGRAEPRGAGGVCSASGIWAVVPAKETSQAKQRLAGLLDPKQREALAAAMLEDVLHALAGVPRLAGVAVVTVDPAASALAARFGARVLDDGARNGHTGAVTEAARRLAAEGTDTILTLPGDVPLGSAADVAAVIAAHRPAPAFTIVPAHDALGSNAVMCSPPGAVPLRFGDDSFFPHLDAARCRGIAPTVVHVPGIALDIDNPNDLAVFCAASSGRRTRTYGFLENAGLLQRLQAPEARA